MFTLDKLREINTAIFFYFNFVVVVFLLPFSSSCVFPLFTRVFGADNRPLLTNNLSFGEEREKRKEKL